MWRSATEEEKAPFVEQEKRVRAKYNDKSRKYREEKVSTDRTSHHAHIESGTRPDNRFVDPNEELAIPSPPRANVDDRIFRSYSGGHPGQNKSYESEHRGFRVYDQDEQLVGPPVLSSNKSDITVRSSSGSSKKIAKQGKSKVTPARPQQYQQMPPHYRYHHHARVENPHYYYGHPPPPPLHPSGSDAFDFFHEEGPPFPAHGNLGEMEPPFNPRQQRPASSHYFPDSFNYHYL
jgi:hypothetical protein